MIWILIAVVLFLAVWIYLSMPRTGRERRAPVTGRAFAHRGLYEADQSVPENSLPAFRRAVEAGYGAELDVQMTKDGEVVVFHALRLFGTEEQIPLFADVLEIFDGKQPLIVELKYAPNWKPLSEKIRQMLAAYNGPACIESFHPSIVRYFRQEDPERVRGQLAQAARAYGNSIPKLNAFAVSRLLTNVATRPDFIAYGLGPKPVSARLCGWLGAMKVCWTARGAENHARRMKENDAVIFEHDRP